MRMRVSLGLAVLAALAPLSRADYVSQTFTLDQSSVLPGGTPYGSVKIEAFDGTGASGGGLTAGQVRLTVTANALPVYDSTGRHFGIVGLGFNTDLTLTPSEISVPKHWKLKTDKFMGGFGEFGWEAIARGRHSENPLVITISGLGANATLSHFLIASLSSNGNPPINGSVYFAARVSGFTIDNDFVDAHSQVIGNGLGFTVPPPGGPGPVGGLGAPGAPEPAAWLLGAVGVGGLGCCEWMRRRTPRGRAS